MSLEECHIRLFIERDLLEVKSWAVHVCNQDTHAILCKVCLACLQNKEAFAAVVVVEFVARFDFVAELILFEAVCLDECNATFNRFALGFAVVEK